MNPGFTGLSAQPETSFSRKFVDRSASGKVGGQGKAVCPQAPREVLVPAAQDSWALGVGVVAGARSFLPPPGEEGPSRSMPSTLDGKRIHQQLPTQGWPRTTSSGASAITEPRYSHESRRRPVTGTLTMHGDGVH